MKKETLIAVFLGAILGVLMAIFVLFKATDIKLDKNKKVVPKISTQVIKNVEIKKQEIVPFKIFEPKDGFLVEKNSILVKGKAIKNSLIIVQSPIKDLIIKNEKEEFSFDMPLALGENVINIVVYPGGEVTSQEKILKIYYFNEKL